MPMGHLHCTSLCRLCVLHVLEPSSILEVFRPLLFDAFIRPSAISQLPFATQIEFGPVAVGRQNGGRQNRRKALGKREEEEKEEEDDEESDLGIVSETQLFCRSKLPTSTYDGEGTVQMSLCLFSNPHINQSVLYVSETMPRSGPTGTEKRFGTPSSSSLLCADGLITRARPASNFRSLPSGQGLALG